MGDNLDFIAETNWKIKVVNNITFELIDFPKKDFKFVNGTVEIVNSITEISHKSLEEDIIDPTIVGFNQDFDKKIIETYQLTDLPTDSWDSKMDEIVSSYSDTNVQKIIEHPI